MSAARLGVHCASTLKLSSRIPSEASLSMSGVGASMQQAMTVKACANFKASNSATSRV